MNIKKLVSSIRIEQDVRGMQIEELSSALLMCPGTLRNHYRKPTSFMIKELQTLKRKLGLKIFSDEINRKRYPA